MEVLHLTLSKKPFEVMVTGEKKEEYREPSKWIRQRLFDKDLNKKQYTHVRFANGYSKDAPYFIAEFKGFVFTEKDEYYEFSNGLELNIKPDTIVIELGEITEKGNLQTPHRVKH